MAAPLRFESPTKMNTEPNRITADGEAMPQEASANATTASVNPAQSVRELLATASRALSDAGLVTADEQQQTEKWQAVEQPLREALALLAADYADDTNASNYPANRQREAYFLCEILRDARGRLRVDTTHSRKLATIDIAEVLRSLSPLMEQQRWERTPEGRADIAKRLEESRREIAEWFAKEAAKESDRLQQYPDNAFGLTFADQTNKIAAAYWTSVVSTATWELNAAEASSRQGDWTSLVERLRAAVQPLSCLLAALEEAQRKLPAERSAADINRRFVLMRSPVPTKARKT